MIKIALISLLLTGCSRYADVNFIVSDISQTVGCNTSPVYVDPKDDKRHLLAKVIILNSRLNECDNSNYFTEKKIKGYKSL